MAVGPLPLLRPVSKGSSLLELSSPLELSSLLELSSQAGSREGIVPSQGAVEPASLAAWPSCPFGESGATSGVWTGDIGKIVS
jgi:hypothetical protein